MTKGKYDSVSTKPVKRFFVEMLTRDLAVEDAILDLLDNCVDGILRSKGINPMSQSPYNGFRARITINKDIFEILDNCGGIPWSEHDRAFRMGRPKNDKPTTEVPLSVGVYGIGMKRAIFKIGQNALISTQNGDDRYEIPISSDWMNDEDGWDLEVNPATESMEQDGTYIVVRNLHQGISERFAAEAFEGDLLDKIQSHYAVIIRKGFQVEVNGKTAAPKPIQLRFADEASDGHIVRPYVFRSEHDGVNVFVAVGLREPIPDAEKTLDEQVAVQYSSEYAGWTVICNDRVVLYSNRDEATGWGTAGVPRYHTQFIAISGIVEFTGDPAKLPTTTTKRGLDFGSPLYQQVLDRMREGLMMFTSFTNKWKTREDEAKAQVFPVPALGYSELKAQSANLTFTTVQRGLPGEQYKPRLPEPMVNSRDVRISYFRDDELILTLAEQMLDNFEDLSRKEVPKKVGEVSFDFAYQYYVEGLPNKQQEDPNQEKEKAE